MTLSEARRYERDPSAAQRDARKVLERHERDAKARKARAKALPGHEAAKRANERKAEKKQQRREGSAVIRGAVFARAGWKCEFCRIAPPAEWHHIIGGPLRRKREAVDTSAAICWSCHRGWGRSDDVVFRWAAQWAICNGFQLALAAIHHRQAKAAEARAAQHPESKP